MSGKVCARSIVVASMVLIGLTISMATTVRARTRANDDGPEDPLILGVCTGQLDGTACNDGNPCTAGEDCRAEACVPPETLGPATSVSVGSGPRGVAAGDWTGDGIPDLAVASSNTSSVYILRGSSSGVFTALGSPVLVGTNPRSIAVGDWNRNGVRDLAVTNASSNDVSILLGDGAGGFTAAGAAVPVGIGPVSVATGDWNGDGKADLAVANQDSGTVSILLGDGSGGFVAFPILTVTVGTLPVSVVAGDWNGDGRADLAVANQTSSNVTILLGVGNGEFGDAPGSPVPVAGGPFSMTAFDSRGSGILDLAVVSITGNTVTVLLGSGTGGFSAGSPIGVGASPRSAAAVDLNRDGRLDLAVANFTDNNLTILLGNGAGGFAVFATNGTGTSPNTVVGGDWNGDGKQDLAVSNTNNFSVSILLNTTTHATDALACNDANACTTTDVCQSGVCFGTPVSNGTVCDDGNPCTLTATCHVGTCVPIVSFLPAIGSPVATGGTGPRPIVTGDWNGDSILDLAVANRTGNSVGILLGNGAGGFSPAVGSPFTFGAGPIAMAVGDWDGNGTRDLVLANSANGANSVTILLGNGTGGFSQAGSPVTVGTVPVAVATGDLNGDGKPDLAVANQNSNNVTILLGNGAGGFTQAVGSPVPVGAGTTPVSVAVGDWNSDAKLDLAVANLAANNLTVLLGDGAGGFTAAAGSPVATATGPFSIAVGDLNGDGRLDLAIANNTSNNVTVLLSSGAGTFSPAAGSPIAVGSGPRSVVARDLNRDGRLDLAVANFGSNDVRYLLGNGAGGFSFGGSLVAPGTGPSSVAGGDLNGDGMQDLVAANTNTNDVSILLNNTPVAADGTTCNDLNPCTQTDTCQSGVCTGGNAVVCAPSDTCHSGRCSVATGTCSNPRLPNGAGCNDGNNCTNGDTCGSGICSPGAPTDCDDGQFCTIGSCDPPTGDCIHVQTPCGDNVACTVDTCNEGTDACVHTVDTTCVHVCNTGAITINDGAPSPAVATPYPSAISISGATGIFSLVAIDLTGVQHTFPDDIDILLAAPTAATNAIVMSDVGGGADVGGVNLILADGATPIPGIGPLVSGTFAPTNVGTGDAWPAPAPLPAGGSLLSAFNGTNPNGSWNLFVADDLAVDSGSITGGWCLNYRLTCNTGADCDDGNPCTADGCSNSACTHSPVVTAAQGVELDWARRLGDVTDETASSVGVDAGGNVYTVGQFSGTVDFDPGPGASSLVAGGGGDAFVWKLDPAGNLVWAKRLGGTGSDAAEGVFVDAGGSVYTVGSFGSTADFDPGPGTFNLTSVTASDTFISKLDPAGNFVWARQLQAEFDEVAADAGGNVYIAGSFSGTMDFDPGPGTFNLVGGAGGSFALKLDAAGNLVWAKAWGGVDSGAYAYAADVDASGNVYAVGAFAGTVDFDPGPGTFSLSAVGSSSAYVLKLDSAGNFVWARGWGGGAYGVAVDASGNVHILGHFVGTVDFDPGPGAFILTATADGFDACVSKLDSAGSFVWAKGWGGGGQPALTAPAHLDVDPGGNVLTAGAFSSVVDFDPGPGTFFLNGSPSPSFPDPFVSKLDSAGNFVWAKQMAGNGNDRARGVVADATGGVITVGFFSGTTDFDPGQGTLFLTPAGLNDSFIVKLRTAGAGSVPDGDEVSGVPLKIGKVGGTQLMLSWGSSCNPAASDYEIYEGVLGIFTSHVPLPASPCSTAGATSATISPSSGNRYYLVVPRTGCFEGSYGRNSSGAERLASGAACLPLSIGACP